ncbi:MAG: hypothetical protein OXN25_23115 [Candidatus Poribacteria bacterium]|nr:hypothetical protein [Candidatus Poribacteria bacterium]MYK18036.1 hypothetical protein [Candidatus Poribacteria bacterium]
MSDQDFRERVLSALERLERKTDQLQQRSDQQYERLEQKVDQQYERLEQKVDQKFESLETRMGLLEQGVGWIRGKMEGKLEAGATLWSRIAVGTAIVSAIIALFALFRGM